MNSSKDVWFYTEYTSISILLVQHLKLIYIMQALSLKSVNRFTEQVVRRWEGNSHQRCVTLFSAVCRKAIPLNKNEGIYVRNVQTGQVCTQHSQVFTYCCTMTVVLIGSPTLTDQGSDGASGILAEGLRRTLWEATVSSCGRDPQVREGNWEKAGV